jgi:hypothetical protein
MPKKKRKKHKPLVLYKNSKPYSDITNRSLDILREIPKNGTIVFYERRSNAR